MPWANYEYGLTRRREYQKTDEGKRRHAAACKASRARHRKRYQANNAVNNAIRDGRLVPLPCFVCGEKAEAHHPNYDAPLDVVWLCDLHHKQAHALGKLLDRTCND